MSLVVVHDYTGTKAIDIATPILQESPLGFNFFLGDANTHRFDIALKNNGSDVSLSGASAGFYIIRPYDSPVFIEATTTNDIISATLTEECFAFKGKVTVHVQVTFSDQTITPFFRYAEVLTGVTGTTIVPGTPVLTLAQMLAIIAAFGVFEEYNPATSYNQYNHVTYYGSTYMWNSATPSVAGVDPTESASWLLIASGTTDQLSVIYINAAYPPAPHSAVVGDGTTDNTAILQALNDHLETLGGGVILLPVPAVNYVVTGTVTVSMNTKFLGISPYNDIVLDSPVLISHEPTTAIDLFDLDAVQITLGYISNIAFENIAVMGNANSHYAFNLYKAMNSQIKNVFISGFDEGVVIEQGLNVDLYNVNIYDADVCIRTKTISTTLTFERIYLHESTTPLIMEQDSCIGATFDAQCKFESCANGLDIYTGNQVVFNNPYVENIPNADTTTFVFNLGVNGTDSGAYSTGTCVINGGDIKGKTGTAGATSGAFYVGKWGSFIAVGGRIVNFHESLVRTADSRITMFLGVLEQQITHKLALTAGALVLGENYLGAATAAGWQAWTPTLTNITIGSGTVTARKRTFGGSCDFEISIVLAADSSIGGDINFTLPHNYVQLGAANGYIYDTNASMRYLAFPFFVTPNKCYVRCLSVTATYAQQVSCTADIPMTWATGDEIHVRGSYEYA